MAEQQLPQMNLGQEQPLQEPVQSGPEPKPKITPAPAIVPAQPAFGDITAITEPIKPKKEQQVLPVKKAKDIGIGDLKISEEIFKNHALASKVKNDYSRMSTSTAGSFLVERVPGFGSQKEIQAEQQMAQQKETNYLILKNKEIQKLTDGGVGAKVSNYLFGDFNDILKFGGNVEKYIKKNAAGNNFIDEGLLRSDMDKALTAKGAGSYMKEYLWSQVGSAANLQNVLSVFEARDEINKKMPTGMTEDQQKAVLLQARSSATNQFKDQIDTHTRLFADKVKKIQSNYAPQLTDLSIDTNFYWEEAQKEAAQQMSGVSGIYQPAFQDSYERRAKEIFDTKYAQFVNPKYDEVADKIASDIKVELSKTNEALGRINTEVNTALKAEYQKLSATQGQGQLEQFTKDISDIINRKNSERKGSNEAYAQSIVDMSAMPGIVGTAAVGRMFGNTLVSAYGSLKSKAALIANALGLESDALDAMKYSGKTTELEYAIEKLPLGDNWFKPGYWAQSIAQSGPSMGLSILATALTKNPYIGGIIAFGSESIENSGAVMERVLQNTGDLDAARKAAGESFVKNFPTVLSEVLVQRMFAPLSALKAAKAPVSKRLGEIGTGIASNAVEEAWQTSTELSSGADAKLGFAQAFFSKDAMNAAIEGGAIGGIFGGASLSMTAAQKAFFDKKNIISPRTQAVAASIMTNGETATMAGVQIDALSNNIDDATLGDGMKEIERVVKTIEDAKKIGLNPQQTQIFASLTQEVSNLKTSLNSIGDESVRKAIEKQIADKQKQIDGVIDGTVPIATIELQPGLVFTSTTDGIRNVMNTPEVQAEVSAGNVKIYTDDAKLNSEIEQAKSAAKPAEPAKGFAVDYLEANDKGELVPTTQTFATEQEANAFVEQRKNEGKIYGSGTTVRQITETAPATMAEAPISQIKTQEDATKISEGPQQEVGQPSNIVQPTGVEQGQPEIGQGEGAVGQATQQAADARNRDFGSQAQQIEATVNLLDEAIKKNPTRLVDDEDGRTKIEGGGFEIKLAAIKGDKKENVTTPSRIPFLPETISLVHLARSKKDKENIIKSGFDEKQASIDSPIPGVYFSSEDWSSIGRFDRKKDDSLYVQVQNDGLLYFDSSDDFVNFLKENNFPFQGETLSDSQIKQLKDKGIKGILLREDFASQSRNELIVIDNSIIKNISKNVGDVTKLPSSFSDTRSKIEAYVKAKADGSNPELVKAVEDLIGQPAAPMVEAAPVAEAAPVNVDELLTADTKEPTNLEKVFNFLDGIDKAIGKELNSGKLSDATRVIPLAAMRVIVKALNALVKGGMTLQEAIRKVAADNNYKEADVADSIKKINNLERVYSNERVKGAIEIANEEAANLKKTEKSSIVAYQKVFSTVQKAIQKIYEAGGIPEAESPQIMAQITQSIARDAVNASYPSAKKISAQEIDKATMSTRSLISKLMSAQEKGAKAVFNKAKEIRNTVNDIFKAMNSQLGTSVQLSRTEFAKVLKEIEDAVFVKPLDESTIDEASANVEAIIQNAHQRKVDEFSKQVRPRVKELIDRIIKGELNKFGSIDAAAYSAFGKAVEYLANNKKEFGIKDIDADNVLIEEFDKKVKELKEKEGTAASREVAPEIFASAQGQQLINSAKQQVDAIIEADKNKKTGKTAASEAFKKVVNDLVKQIDAMFARGNTPAGINSATMVNAAYGIAQDAVNSAFPTTQRISDRNVEILSKSSALEKQIRDLARGAKDAITAWRNASTALGKDIKSMVKDGKLTAKQAANIIQKFGKINILSPKAVGKFVDYMSKVFADAEYENKLSAGKKVRKDISKLSKNKDKDANLREVGKRFLDIDPSMVDDIDAYNDMAAKIKESLAGSKARKGDVSFASMVNIDDASNYIKDVLASQDQKLRTETAAEIQELMGIDASDFSYDDMLALLEGDKPISKDNESIIRTTIDKAFGIYSSIIKKALSTGVDPMTDAPFEVSESQKSLINRFMDMDLGRLTPKEALQAVDALNNFIQNKSTAKMESVVSRYTGKLNAKKVKDKGIKSVPLSKYFSKGLGRVFAEQLVNLGPLFERMFKGVKRGGFVEDMSGLTKVKNGKALAEATVNRIAKEFVDTFYKSKPNGEIFNSVKNMVERGMIAFLSRNVIGTQAERDAEFNRRKNILKESIEALSRGSEKEKKKAKEYKEIYDKLEVEGSGTIQDITSKADATNVEAVNWWTDKWSEIYPQLSDLSQNVYNRILDKDTDYNPDRFKSLSDVSKLADITNEESAFHYNTGEIYKKETGVLMTATRPESLPKGENNRPTRYIDLSFDSNNANSMYDALIDINTAAAVRQVDAFFKSEEFSDIVITSEDRSVLEERVSIYIKKIRSKAPFQNDELSKAIKRLHNLAAVGVGQALAGVTQPFKQVVPSVCNTLVNAGSLDIKAVLDKSKNGFINRSGYGIANRGVESQAQIDSINRIIEVAASSNPQKLLRTIEKANKVQLDVFLVKPDALVARASWMTYYEQSLREQGIDPATIDWDTHEGNEEAGNYAQRMVDRQQNISDPSQAGKLLADSDNSFKNLIVKMVMPFASFRLNQSVRLANDISTLSSISTATKEDKIVAARSLAGYAVEVAVFRGMSIGIAILLGNAAKYLMGEEEKKKDKEQRIGNLMKGQVTSTATELISPVPVLDKVVQQGIFTLADEIQNIMEVPEKDKLNVYQNKPDTFLVELTKSLGLLGITFERAVQFYDLVNLSALNGEFEDNFGRTRKIRNKDKEVLRDMIGPSLASTLGLLPTEVNSVIRYSLKDAKRRAVVVGARKKGKKSGLGNKGLSSQGLKSGGLGSKGLSN